MTSRLLCDLGLLSFDETNDEAGAKQLEEIVEAKMGWWHRAGRPDFRWFSTLSPEEQQRLAKIGDDFWARRAQAENRMLRDTLTRAMRDAVEEAARGHAPASDNGAEVRPVTPSVDEALDAAMARLSGGAFGS